jgi:hypothetical protein
MRRLVDKADQLERKADTLTEEFEVLWRELAKNS